MITVSRRNGVTFQGDVTFVNGDKNTLTYLNTNVE